MGYWNWINDIYNFEDACFQYFRSQDEVKQLTKIIKDNLGEDYLYDADGNYKIKFQDEYDGFKLNNYKDNEKLSKDEALTKAVKLLKEWNEFIKKDYKPARELGTTIDEFLKEIGE